MLTVSVIIPSRNESQDIRETIEACLRLDGPLKEIIVVDDSDDDTPEIVGEYVGEKVVLLHREVNRNGCCGARGEGLRLAGGDICILLNADVRPGRDFLTKIVPHYENGADFLVIMSRVSNDGNMWGSYAQARTESYSLAQLDWTEGFSCRRSAALGVDFPGDYPIPFCRDYLLGRALRTAGHKRHFDETIIIEHVAPDTFRSFWNTFLWRGTFLAPTVFFQKRRSAGYAIAWTVLKAVYEFGQACTIVFPLTNAIRLKHALKHGGSYVSLFVVDSIMHLAVGAGNIKGVFLLLRHFYAAPSGKVARNS